MADGRDYARRFGSLFLASLFLITTVAFTAIVFWQTRNQEAQDDQLASLQDSLEDQTTNDQPPGGTMLEGTNLENFTPLTAAVTELQIVDLVEGTGDAAGEGSTVTAHYTGALASNGKIFQSSLDGGQPFTSALNGLIEGWQKGIPGMKTGGTRRLIIPYTQAYGEAGSPPSIPARADLVFDIQLISVQ